MRQVYQTEDGKIFDTEKEAMTWENGKEFTLRRIKQEFTELSKAQYKDKRNIGWVGECVGYAGKNHLAVRELASLQSRIAIRARKLASLQRSWLVLKGKHHIL